MEEGKDIIIQKEVKVSQEWINNQIEKYKRCKPTMLMGFGDFEGNSEDIIKEIKKLSKAGKRVLLMNYEFENSVFYKGGNNKDEER